MKKLFIFLFLVGSVSVIGCGPKAEQPKEETAQSEAPGVAAEATAEKTAEAPSAAAAVEDNSAERAGSGDFDATGIMPCAQAEGQPMTQCNFGVARSGYTGTATVVITKPDGSKRTLFFTNGKLTGADTSQADGYGEPSSEVKNGLYMIKVGPERYEMSESVLFGG